jgi:hypothetical protein
MIVGTKNWDNRNCYYVQTNNPTDEYLRKTMASGWLVSCGPTAAVSCMAAMGYDLDIVCKGGYRPQPEEVLMDYFNDPANYPKFREVRKDIDPGRYAGNEVPQYYPIAVKEVFDVSATFLWLHDFNKIIAFVKSGKAVQICLKAPGHFLAVVAYDDETESLIYNDSWPGRHEDGDGFNCRMVRYEYDKNVEPYAIVYGD